MVKKVLLLFSILLFLGLTGCSDETDNNSDLQDRQEYLNVVDNGNNNEIHKQPSVEYGCSSAEEAVDTFWNCIRSEDDDLAQIISFSHYIRFKKTDREMLVNPSWYEYLNIFDNHYGDTQEYINRYKYAASSIETLSCNTEIEEMSVISHMESRIYDEFGVNETIQGAYRYKYTWDNEYCDIEVIEMDNRWFTIALLFKNNYYFTGRSNYEYDIETNLK